MRLYTFGNFYLSSIQQGIQALHVLGEMMVSSCSPNLRVWAEHHKTVICLNGGMASDLDRDFMSLVGHKLRDNVRYPMAHFHEEEDALAGSTTCWGIILPKEVYEAVPNRSSPNQPLDELSWTYTSLTTPCASYGFTSYEAAILRIMASKGLAR